MAEASHVWLGLSEELSSRSESPSWCSTEGHNDVMSMTMTALLWQSKNSSQLICCGLQHAHKYLTNQPISFLCLVKVTVLISRHKVISCCMKINNEIHILCNIRVFELKFTRTHNKFTFTSSKNYHLWFDTKDCFLSFNLFITCSWCKPYHSYHFKRLTQAVLSV